MGEDAAAGTGHLMIIWLRHHNDHEARACSVVRPNRSQPNQPHDPGTCNRPAETAHEFRQENDDLQRLGGTPNAYFAVIA